MAICLGGAASRNAKSMACTVILVLALTFKFWPIARMEITDGFNDPFHDMEQILLHQGLCYGPGTGEVGPFFYHLGIPFRIGIEAAFLGSVFLVLRALPEWPTRSCLALGL